MAKNGARKKAANGYKLPDPLPLGEILQDRFKKQWKLGPSIGKGGFGEIYSAKPAESTSSNYPFVIKIEPHANGPLFVEMHFYMRNGKETEIKDFMKEKGRKTFGMPVFLGSGSHEHKNEKYRFVVMEKFGSDIWKLFLENNKEFPVGTVFKIALQILEVLEYIHRHGYVHADIKGANILLGLTKETLNKQVYLVDFGLATKFTTDKEFKPNPKKAHDGTIEYLSRDAHQGVQTRRGDLEILAYNMIQWLGCTLPWEKRLTNPVEVQKSKEENMKSADKMLKACFGSKQPPSALKEFLTYLLTLRFDAEPDYEKITKIFLKGIKDAGDSFDSPLQFNTAKKGVKKRKSEVAPSPDTNKKSKAEEASSDSGSEEEEKPVKVKKVVRKPVRKEKENDENVDMTGYTDAMKEIMKKKMNGAKKKVVRRKPQVQEVSTEGYTESMKELVTKKSNKKLLSTPTSKSSALREVESRSSPRLKNKKTIQYSESD